MPILERKGNRNTWRKILVAQEGSSIDTQLGHERTTPDLVSVARGIMHYRGGQFSFDRRGTDFSRGDALVCYQGADWTLFIFCPCCQL